MGLIQELADLIGNLKFYEIVFEYQQGLYFHCGNAVEKRRKKITLEEQAKFKSEESKLLQQMGYLPFLPFRRPALPESYVQSKLTGLPLHRNRFSKVLQPGFYFHLPIIEEIVKDYKQEKVLNLGNITVPTVNGDDKSILVSCNLRYELMDFYKAYTSVHDYEASLKDHTLSILAKHSRGKKYKEWQDPQVISQLEEEVLNELSELVTEKWGLKIHRVYITDNVPCYVQRLAHEGHSAVQNSKLYVPPTED